MPGTESHYDVEPESTSSARVGIAGFALNNAGDGSARMVQGMELAVSDGGVLVAISKKGIAPSYAAADWGVPGLIGRRRPAGDADLTSGQLGLIDLSAKGLAKVVLANPTDGSEIQLAPDYSQKDDDPWTPGTSRGVGALGLANDEAIGAIDAVEHGDGGLFAMNHDNRYVRIHSRAYKRGGAKPYYRRSSADTNAVVIQAGPTQIYSGYLYNRAAASRFVRFYDKATAPNPASDTPKAVYELGASSGNPFAVRIAESVGLEFLLGLGMVITGGEPDNDTTAVAAGDVRVNLGISPP